MHQFLDLRKPFLCEQYKYGMMCPDMVNNDLCMSAKPQNDTSCISFALLCNKMILAQIKNAKVLSISYIIITFVL